MVSANGAGDVDRRPERAGQLPADLVAKVDKEWASEVQKRVRSRAVSMTSVTDKDRGKQKPTPVSWNTLRLMGNRNEWVRAVLKTRKNQISQVEWDVTLKDTDDASGAAARAAKSLKKLLSRPMMHGARPQSMSWRHWIGMFLEDLLVLDRACVEKERDGNGWIVALHPVDGSTIRPRLDSYGGYDDEAYLQVVDGQTVATFGMEDLIVAIDNPQVDVALAGYGMSPLENLVVSVTADLHAAKFNADYFTKGALPEGMISLGEDVQPEDVDAFRHYWATEIVGRPWSTPIMGGSKDPEFIQWRQSNRDMQFMEYQDWLLQRICAVYQISKQELGAIEDVNRSTADSQDSSNDRKGIQPLLSLIKDVIDLEIVGEHGQGLGDYLEFSWAQVGESAEEVNARFQPMHESGVVSGSEWREAQGMDADGDPKATMGKEGLRMHLTAGQLQPLPDQKDAKVLGAAAMQDREDEQGQQQHEQAMQQAQAAGPTGGDDGGDQGPASPTPWQPADPDHPDVKQAMADHDDEHGIGPRNVGKSHPDGHDRHPALTESAEGLEEVFDHATKRLVEQLAEAIGA